jgi:hypothetical protein
MSSDDSDKDKLTKIWDQAFENINVAVPIGRNVFCDGCSWDWTERTETGGFIFGSYAYCPTCAPVMLRGIKSHNEEQYIKGFCPPSQSFADWCREMRGPDASIKVSVYNKPPAKL